MNEGVFSKNRIMDGSAGTLPHSFCECNEVIIEVLLGAKKVSGGNRAPGIVTANALTGINEINLPEYALRFAAAGFPTLIFDHRYWGESTGTPRFHVVPMEQREDIQSAISFLTRQPEIDPGRIGGWGISMGGGKMLFLAAW